LACFEQPFPSKQHQPQSLTIMAQEIYPSKEAVSSRVYPASAGVATSLSSNTRLVSWGAIIAGAVAALGIHLLLTVLGVGIGVGAADPATDQNPVANISIGAAIAWTVSALISLWAGGWVAGRLANPIDRTTGRLHGFLVWSAATIVMFALLTTGLGAVMGGAARVLGKGLSAAGSVAQKAGSGAGDVVQQLVQRQGGAVQGYANEVTQVFNQNNNGNNGQPADPMRSPARATREVSSALFHLFNDDNAANRAANRDAVVNALTSTTGIAPDRARQMVDEWVAAYDRTQKELQDARYKAEQEARAAADRAAKATTKAAIWTFIAFVIGAIVATWGGNSGAQAISETEPLPKPVA
jgi:hypothetical protein